MFDRDHGVGASASHRVFQLVGQSGRHHEASKLWAHWKTLNGVQLDRDITPGFFKSTAEISRSYNVSGWARHLDRYTNSGLRLA
jgi:hypothetical protein